MSTAVVTGAASGFGLAVANDLTARGWAVAMFDRDADRLASVADGRLAMPVDVAVTADLQAAAAAVDGCDLLWANVGVQHFGTVESTDEEVWRWMLDVNVVGAVRTVQAFLPRLQQSPQPRLAFTASTNALAPAARLGAYQASKYAVVGLAETLRLELPDVAVSVVYPAGMITRHLESSADARPEALGPGEVAEEEIAAMMASRPMTEEDLTTPEAAAAVAVEGVLAGEPHIVTHGQLRR